MVSFSVDFTVCILYFLRQDHRMSQQGDFTELPTQTLLELLEIILWCVDRYEIKIGLIKKEIYCKCSKTLSVRVKLSSCS